MKILVDADACPVKEIVVAVAKDSGLQVVMICDTAHILDDGYSRVITVDQGPDSADMAVFNLSEKGDIIVTGDYGVAAMCLGKGARPINHSGRLYSASNIDGLLFERHIGRKIRQSGGRTANMKKRQPEDDRSFEEAMRSMIHPEVKQ